MGLLTWDVNNQHIVIDRTPKHTHSVLIAHSQRINAVLQKKKKKRVDALIRKKKLLYSKKGIGGGKTKEADGKVLM